MQVLFQIRQDRVIEARAQYYQWHGQINQDQKFLHIYFQYVTLQGRRTPLEP